MNLQEFHTKHGNQATEELLDKVIIEESFDSDSMRMFLIKHRIIKSSTRIVRGRMWRERIEREWKRLSNGNGITGWVDVTPYMRYHVYVKNGRNEQIINVQFKEQEIAEVQEVMRGDNASNSQ